MLGCSPSVQLGGRLRVGAQLAAGRAVDTKQLLQMCLKKGGGRGAFLDR